jgi:hypothetical protein
MQTDNARSGATEILPGREVLASGTLGLRDKAQAARAPLATRRRGNGSGSIFLLHRISAAAARLPQRSETGPSEDTPHVITDEDLADV